MYQFFNTSIYNIEKQKQFENINIIIEYGDFKKIYSNLIAFINSFYFSPNIILYQNSLPDIKNLSFELNAHKIRHILIEINNFEFQIDKIYQFLETSSYDTKLHKKYLGRYNEQL